MYHPSPQETFILGVGSLWVFSAAVGALEPPTATSGPGYRWAYRFLKTISGDLGSVFGKYLPNQQVSVQQTTETVIKETTK